MGFEESAGAKCFTAGWARAAKVCDSCKTSPASLFCRVDSAFLCIACDSKVHGLGISTHDRVWICEVCEHAPASVTCKADAAALCVTCDRDIHSANPLSRRHERVPVVPFYDNADSVMKSSGIASFLVPGVDEPSAVSVETSHTCSTGLVPPIPASSWLLPNPISKLAVDAPDMKSVDFFFSEPDPFLEFDYPVSIHNPGADSVVPDQNSKPISHPPVTQQFMNQSLDKYVEIDFANSKFNSFHNNSSYTSQSLSQSMSSSDAGIVPEGSSMSEMSYSFVRNNNTGVDLAGTAFPPAATASDREARVLRYREKRKNRKFEKTIRYASRKAYAETRPRIKGRFAKRTDITEADASSDRMFMPGRAGAFMAEAAAYGVVPSF